MGKQRFRLSHMIPNAWFYRLRDMNTAAGGGTTAVSHNKKALSTTKNHPRNSFCYTPKLHQVYTSSPNPPFSKLGSIYIQPTELARADQEMLLSPTTSSYYESPLSESTHCSCGMISSITTDVKIELQKPPQILTKPTKSSKEEETCGQRSISIKIVKETRRKKPVSRVKVGSKSLKTQVPKRIDHGNNDENNLFSNCCIVKSTFDPHKDLKESMVEMIVENNLRESKDLEKLLAWYLCLNSSEYHDIIVKAFEEIWLTFDFGV